MRKPVRDWTVVDVLSIPAEDSTVERKGAKALDLSDNGLVKQIAKQVSAFANTGGGCLIYGIANNGNVDSGGVGRVQKGKQNTKEWLENTIASAVDPKLIGFNVYEIGADDVASGVAKSKAIYVVEIPDSDLAPHQSQIDWVYYIRLAGSSHPAPHRIIEDIRNRRKHPQIQIESVRIDRLSLPHDYMPEIRGRGRMWLRMKIANCGRVKPSHAAVYLELPQGGVLEEHSPGLVKMRRDHQHRAFFEFIDPLYPDMALEWWVCVFEHMELLMSGSDSRIWLLGRTSPEKYTIRWRVFADDAPAKEGTWNARIDLDFNGLALQSIPDPRMKQHYRL